MDQFSNDSSLESQPAPGQPLDLRNESEAIVPGDYATAYGEELIRTLDLDTWEPGEELARLYQRLEAEIQSAVCQEEGMRAPGSFHCPTGKDDGRLQISVS
jgi:hypothetical protein